MSRRTPFLLLFFSLLIFPFGQLSAAPNPSAWNSSRACTDRESWTIPQRSPLSEEAFRSAFIKSTRGDRNFAEQMNQALAFQRKFKSPQGALLYRYWVGRNFYNQGLLHQAKRAFETTLAETPSTEGMPVATAALECLNEIHRQSNQLIPSPELSTTLIQMASKSKTREQSKVVGENLYRLLAFEVSESRHNSALSQSLLSALSQVGDPWSSLGRAILYTKTDDTSGVVQSVTAWLNWKKLNPRDQDHLQQDWALLLLGRSYFKAGRFAEAIKVYEAIPKKSNLFVDALNEMAWAHLSSENYGRSIGLSLDLLTSHLKKTFSPEAQMVAAISFVELCQFPSAIKTVDQFKESYRSTYQWLYQWEKAGPNSQSLYDLSVDYLQASTQTKGSSVPDAIGTEWIRSNHFLAGQEEINLLLRSQKRIRELKEELKVSQLPSSKALAQNLENFERGVPERIQTLTGKIHSALARRTSELLKQLSEVAANNAMIEIEAYQGISKEIQFRKGVAEFDALAERVKKSDQLIAQAPKKASTWDWGRSPASTGPGVEIWEDELGMLRAKTLDRCKELAQIKENSEQSR